MMCQIDGDAAVASDADVDDAVAEVYVVVAVERADDKVPPDCGTANTTALDDLLC